jgi:hypothetical protein
MVPAGCLGNFRVVGGRLLAGVIAVALSVGVTACGGSGGSSSADTTAVQRTVTQVLHALASGNGATVCSLATPAGRGTLAKALPHSTCTRVVDLVSAHLSATQKQALGTAKVGKVTINGDHATVPDTSITSAKGSLKGFLQSGAAPTRLTKQSDGSWRISG